MNKRLTERERKTTLKFKEEKGTKKEKQKHREE